MYGRIVRVWQVVVRVRGKYSWSECKSSSVLLIDGNTTVCVCVSVCVLGTVPGPRHLCTSSCLYMCVFVYVTVAGHADGNLSCSRAALPWRLHCSVSCPIPQTVCCRGAVRSHTGVEYKCVLWPLVVCFCMKLCVAGCVFVCVTGFLLMVMPQILLKTGTLTSFPFKQLSDRLSWSTVLPVC